MPINLETNPSLVTEQFLPDDPCDDCVHWPLQTIRAEVTLTTAAGPQVYTIFAATPDGIRPKALRLYDKITATNKILSFTVKTTRGYHGKSQ